MADSSNTGGIGFELDVLAVRSALKETGERLNKLTGALKEGAKIVQGEWKHRVPVASGNLRMRGSGVKASSANSRKYGGPFAEVYVTTQKVPYAAVQEFGGRIPRYQGKAKNQRFTNYKPHLHKSGSYFLYPAFEDKKSAACAEVDHAVGKLVKEMF